MENRSPAGRGPGRNRKSKNKRNRRGNTSDRPSKRKGPPAPPQTKIVVGNILDVAKYGTVAKTLDLIRKLVNAVNDKSSPGTRILQIDEASMDFLVKEEEAVNAAQLAWAEEKKQAKAAGELQDENMTNADASENVEANGSTGAENCKSDGTVDAPKSTEVADLKKACETPNPNAHVTVGVRLVYVVPPKKTRRRGDKPGCAYLVLTAPSIPEKEPPAPVVIAKPAVKQGTTDEQHQQEPTTPPTVEDDGAPAKEEVTMKEEGVSGAPPLEAPVDYASEVAKGRLLLMQAIESMEAYALEDAKSKQELSGCLVSVAMNGKTYRNLMFRKDRREGTIEQTADYKSFLSKAEKEKEERLARPKPVPGGGVSTTATTSTENGQPISTLVAHIRNKRQEASKRKKPKKKAKDAARDKNPRKKKGKDGAKRNAGEENKSKGGKNKDGKKKKAGGGGKQKNAKNGPQTVHSVLKPPNGVSGGGQHGPQGGFGTSG